MEGESSGMQQAQDQVGQGENQQQGGQEQDVGTQQKQGQQAPQKDAVNGDDDTNAHDIVIGDFEMSWNLEGGEAFAISPTSINEVGCIHTTQGLEFEYIGVIIGDDLRYEDGHIVTDYTKRAKSDQSIKGLKKMAQSDPERAQKLGDEIIKNTYRTLMTRGMKGCCVFATDPGLEAYLKQRCKEAYEYRSIGL